MVFISTCACRYATYSGPLYRVERAHDNTSTDIGLDAPGGYANATTQEAFCSGERSIVGGGGCTISKIYDQSSRGNNLAPPVHPTFKGKCDAGADASRAPLTVSGHPAYAVFIPGGAYGNVSVPCTGRGGPGVGYRNDTTQGVPTGDDPEVG